MSEASRLPYVPPRSSIDPTPPELIVVFLEAVARKTTAFLELRDQILPEYGRRGWKVVEKRPLRFRGQHSTLGQMAPLEKIKIWLERWNLSRFQDYEVNQRIESFVFQILDW